MANLPLLAICIPTRNGGDTLINNVVNILKVDDNRFVVHVNDNCSSDDTLNRLEIISNNDSRLIFTSNETSVSAYVNFNEVLTKAEAEYLYLVIDKESLNPSHLIDFLNFLEREQPYYGRAYFSPNEKLGVRVFKKGVDAISNISHYGNTHTSGFFYRKALYNEEIGNLLELTNGGNLWITDMISLCLGFTYNGVDYNTPLYKYNPESVLGGLSKSKFTKENLYFYGKQRCVDYNTFLSIVLYKDSSKEVLPIINALTYRYLCLVTYEQRRFFSDKQRCLHYGVDSRRVPYIEMLHWCREIKKSLNRECKNNNLQVSNVLFDFNVFRCLLYAFLNKRPYLVKVTRPIIQLLSRMKHNYL